MQVTTILLVEDDEEDIEFFTSVVRQIDPTIKVNIATSKDQLFAEMLHTSPDLFFVDSFLQNESGFECIKKIKENKKFESIPVIMYTGAFNSKSINDGFKAGAALYIVKPPTLPEVKTVLQQIFSFESSGLSISKRYYTEGNFHEFEIE